MERFLCHLIEELDLQNFGISYENLVPVTCSLKWVRDAESEKTEFTKTIMKYLLPRSEIDDQYLVLQSKTRYIVDMYWKEIVSENREFNKIK